VAEGRYVELRPVAMELTLIPVATRSEPFFNALGLALIVGMATDEDFLPDAVALALAVVEAKDEEFWPDAVALAPVAEAATDELEGVPPYWRSTMGLAFVVEAARTTAERTAVRNCIAAMTIRCKEI
jgi:hypothetical protein